MKQKIGNLLRGFKGFFENLKVFPKINQEIPHFEIGKTVQNRSINVFRIGEGNKKILYVGGVHGNEIGTVKLMNTLANWAWESKEKLKNYSIFIIPCLNLDGFKIAQQNPDYFSGGKVGRFNANSTDLNRNFPTASFKEESVWSSGKDYQVKTKVFCGKFGGSEPETKALIDLIKKENITTFFAFHNAGKEVMGNNNDRSQRLVKLFVELSGYRYISQEIWEKLDQQGTAKEWCEENGIAYIEVEGGSRWGSDWQNQKKAILETMIAENQ